MMIIVDNPWFVRSTQKKMLFRVQTTQTIQRDDDNMVMFQQMFNWIYTKKDPNTSKDYEQTCLKYVKSSEIGT